VSAKVSVENKPVVDVNNLLAKPTILSRQISQAELDKRLDLEHSQGGKVVLVYLDIDGVVIPAGQDPNTIAPAFAQRLRRILDATGAKLVVSSHRRQSRDGVLALLSASGFGQADLADDWATDLNCPDLDDDLSIRGQEIARHAARNQADRYVILDDCPCLPDQAWRHVQTDDRVGLTDGDVDVAINILKGATVDA
jgi:hypothetical protein